MRRAFLHSLCSWLITACMELPNQPILDAASPELMQLGPEGGQSRPKTGLPYLGPECETGVSPPTEPASLLDASAPPESSAEGPRAEAPLPPSPGSLVITEVMADPQALRDDAGEWFEVHNPGELTLALEDCALDDGGTSLRSMPPVVLPAGGYAVFARSAEVAFSPAATLAFSLANSADRLALLCGGLELDRVAYGPGFPLKAGASMALDPEASDAQANDSAAAWCLGQTGAGGDLGSPGEANPDCDASEPDGDAGAP